MTFFDFSDDRTKVKVCGLTTGENACSVVELGVDAIGINFWPKSKRYIEPIAAAEWLGELAGRVCRIGLFVNAGIDEIEAAVDFCVLDAIQLHGEETPDFCDEISAFGLPVIKAIGVKGDAPVVNPNTFPTKQILLDAYAPDEFGGTGRSFRWDIVRNVIEEDAERFLILAGGLTPDNVAEAIAKAKPHAVDVASGVESSPGVKDLELTKRFLEAVRSGYNR